MYIVCATASPMPPQIGRHDNSSPQNLLSALVPYSMLRYSPTFTPSIQQCASPFARLPVLATSTTSQRCHTPRVNTTGFTFAASRWPPDGTFCSQIIGSSGPLPLPVGTKNTHGFPCNHTNPILFTSELWPCQLLDSFTQKETYSCVYPWEFAPSIAVNAGS